jgi:hypothetical protein
MRTADDVAPLAALGGSARRCDNLDGNQLETYLGASKAGTSRGTYLKVCAITNLFLNHLVKQGYVDGMPLETTRP